MSERKLFICMILWLACLPRAAGAAWDATADWSADSDQADAYMGYSVTTCDVNGDGYSDLIHGIFAYNGPFEDSGRLRVHMGGAGGPSPSPSLTIDGTVYQGFLGMAVSYAGDVNGDGYDDVIAGEPGYNSVIGRIQLFLGSSSGLPATASQTIDGTILGQQFGSSVAGVGDVNGDGYDDVAVGSPQQVAASTTGRAQVFLGGPGGLNSAAVWTKDGDAPGRYLGSRVAAAGDVNADGYDDLLVRQDGNGTSIPGVFLFLGASYGVTASAVWSTTAAVGSFGYQDHDIAPAGDVNGDGYSDFLVGDSMFESAGLNYGRVRLFHGTSTVPSTTAGWQKLGEQPSSGFGTEVASAGDVNGDGFADVAVGAPSETDGQTDEGVVHVYFGGAGGPSEPPVTRLQVNQAAAGFGLGLATGDVNGDGYSDVIVGAGLYDSGENAEGALFAFHGGGDVYRAFPEWTWQNNLAASAVGHDVVLGDWNGDGHSDAAVVALSAPGANGGSGRISIFTGSESGLSTSPSLTLHEPVGSAAFGYSIANAGDVQGDGYDDLLVGAPFAANVGKVYLYSGGFVGLSSTPAWTLTGTRTGEALGKSVAGAGDVNGDGLADILVGQPDYSSGFAGRGAVFLHLGAMTWPSSTATWSLAGTAAGQRFGAAVASAGDVNGDGFSDVLVGAPGETVSFSSEGVARIYAGSATAAMALTWSKRGDWPGAGFGASVAMAGDVNSDGLSDILIGAPDWDNGQTDEGKAFLFLGLQSTPYWQAEGNESGARFGARVARAGDVNGDGAADFLVGAPFGDNGFSDEGVARLYLGPSGASGAAWTEGAGQTFSRFGLSLAAGDINADGFSDVLVGAPDWDSGQSNEGGVFSYFGNRGDGLDREARQGPYTPTIHPIALLGRAPQEDAVRFLLRGRTPFGRGNIRMEYDHAPLGTALNAPAFLGPWTDTGAPSGASGSQWLLAEQVTGLTPDTPYCWRARVRTDSPLFPRSRWFHVNGNSPLETDFRTAPGTTGVAEGTTPVPAPELRALRNPFRGPLRLEFHLGTAGPVELSVYDAQGRRIERQALGHLDAGWHEAAWRGLTADGAPTVAGVYFVELRTPEGRTRRKVVRIE